MLDDHEAALALSRCAHDDVEKLMRQWERRKREIDDKSFASDFMQLFACEL